MNIKAESMHKRIETEIERIKRAIDNKCDIMHDSSFETGTLGLALFYTFYSMFANDKKYLDKAEVLILKAFNNLNFENFHRSYKTDSIDNHLSHFGRFIEFYKKNELMQFDADAYMAKLDTILFDLMNSKASMGNFDYQGGALASGFYFISRTSNIDNIEKMLSSLTLKIKEKSVPDANGGIYWSLPILYNRVYLGLSHGSALIMSFICNVLQRGIETDICSEILYKAAKFLINQRSDFGKGLFPNFVDDPEKGPKQFSLCYGDIGIGYSLLRTGRLLEDKKIEEIANNILSDCLNRKKEDNLTLDGSITYGAAGLATAFGRIFKCQNDKRYLNASDYWYERILDYAIYSNDYAGYKSRVSDEDSMWNLGFSWGIAGIGVALMRSINRQLPDISPLTLIA